MKRASAHGPDSADAAQPPETAAPSLERREEELVVSRREVPTGTVRARKHVEEVPVAEMVDRRVESGDVERVAAAEGDSGEIETLPDGSVSIPILEEELVITKRVVVRERIVIRKHADIEHHLVEATLRRERLELETDEPTLASDDG